MRPIWCGVFVAGAMIALGIGTPAVPANGRLEQFIFHLPSSASCTTTTANLTYATVSAAVSGATAGDTVCLPDGSVTWASTLTLTKAITLKSVNACTLDGNSRPSSCSVAITCSASPCIAVNPATPSGDPVIRVTGLSLTCGGNYGIEWANSSSTQALTNVRVDHGIVQGCASGGLIIDAAVWGVYDHMRSVDNYVHIRCFGYGNESTTWDNFPASPGTANRPFAEDSTFVQSDTNFAFISECGQGGSLILRHNIIDMTGLTTAGFWEVFDYHGNQDGYPTSRGTVEFETYANAINLSNTIDRVNIRGGTGKFFNNTVTQAGSGNTLDVEMTEYDNTASCESHYGLLSSPPGYDPIADMFYFGNTRNGGSLSLTRICTGVNSSDDDDFIRLNQEYFTPSEGTALPGTCTDDTYFGNTSTGVISKCHPANTWTTYYTPYTYPHPKAGS